MFAARINRATRTTVNRIDLAGERDIDPCPLTHRAFIPGVVAALGNVKQPAHCPYRKGGLVHSHEPEERFGVALLSFANQAAAFDKISRSSFSCRFSRRSRVSSSRSLVVRPPSPRLASRSACLTHFRIVQSVGPNSLDRSPYLRPAQTNSTICLQNSAGYFVPLFAIADSFSVDTEVSRKAGQAHSVTTALRFPRPGPPAAVFPSVTGTTRALRRPATNTALFMYSLRRPQFPSPSVRSHAAETSVGPGPALEPRHHWL